MQRRAKMIQGIVQIPLTFRSRGDASFIELLLASGFVKGHESVSEEELRQVLAENPDAMGAWMQWSEDKRTSSGWHVLADASGGYVVDFHPSNKIAASRQRFPSVIDAVAAFIKREIENTRGAE